MNKYFLSILFIFFMNNCSLKEQNINFQHIQEVHAVEAFNSMNLLIGDTHQFIMKDNYVFIYSPLDTTSHLVIDINNKINTQAFNIGQGPGEILNPSARVDLICNKSKKNIEVYDIASNKIVSYNLDSILSGTCSTYNSSFILEESKSLEQKPIYVQRLNDSLFITQGFYTDAIFRIYNINNKKHEAQTASLYNKKLSIDDVINLGNIFALSPNRKHIVRATQMDGIIECYEVNKDSIIKNFTHHQFIAENSKFSTNRRYGYISACISNNKIYGLYSTNRIGEKENAFSSKEIHVFDFNGNPLECLLTDIPLCAIEWCEPQKAIYGISKIPEIHLVKIEYN